MTTIKDEPAFPIHGPVTGYQFPGLTLRDYFAAKAMAVMVDRFRDDTFAYIAQEAYTMADAMLQERAK